MRKKEAFTKLLYTILALSVLVIVWQVLVSFTALQKTTPPPLEVLTMFFKSMVDPIGPFTLIGHLFVSLKRVFIGFFLASVVGVVLGIGMGRSRTIRAIVSPIFEMLRPIPPVAWIPIAILWFGIGEGTKYFIIYVAAFTIVTLNAYNGAIKVDATLVGAAEMLGSSNRQIFSRIILPSCMPQIFAGLQLAMSTSWCAVLAAEMVRSSEGLGWVIIRGSDTANMTQVMVGMIAIGLSGIVLSNGMRSIERWVCSWNIIDN